MTLFTLKKILESIPGRLIVLATPIFLISSPSHAVTGFTGAFELNGANDTTWNFDAPFDLTPEYVDGDCDLGPGFSCIDYSKSKSDGNISITAGASTSGTTTLTWPQPENTNPNGYFISFTITCNDCNEENTVFYTVGGVRETLGNSSLGGC